MLALTLILALVQDPAAAPPSDVAAGEAAYAAAEAATEGEDLRPLGDLCEALGLASVTMSRSEREVRSGAERFDGLATVVADVQGAGSEDQRALGMIEALMLTNASRQKSAADALEGALPQIALAYRTWCPR